MLAQSHGVRVHLDGARLMNAAVALGVPPARIMEHCDSVSLCFSKVGKLQEGGGPQHRRLSCVLGLLGRQLLTLGPLTPSPNKATVSAPPHPSCPLPSPKNRDAHHGQVGRPPLFLQGLGAPVGALVGGPKDFIEEAWRLRKALGGGMRQAGVLAAAALVGLADAEEMLQRDHQNAQRFAKGSWTPHHFPLAPGWCLAGPL